MYGLQSLVLVYLPAAAGTLDDLSPSDRRRFPTIREAHVWLSECKSKLIIFTCKGFGEFFSKKVHILPHILILVKRVNLYGGGGGGCVSIYREFRVVASLIVGKRRSI